MIEQGFLIQFLIYCDRDDKFQKMVAVLGLWVVYCLYNVDDLSIVDAWSHYVYGKAICR